MRNLIILGLLAFGAYKGYEHFLQNPTGAYDEHGNPLTLVFTFDQCGKYCERAIKLLDKRNVNYTEYNLSENESHIELMKKYGGKRTMPYIVTGNHQLSGYNKHELVSALVGAHGEEVLSRNEQIAMQKHFDEEGYPQVVMYSTERCGYCKQAREYFEDKGIAFIERDIDKSSSAMMDYKRLAGEGTPLIYVGYQWAGGFNKKKLEKTLQVL